MSRSNDGTSGAFSTPHPSSFSERDQLNFIVAVQDGNATLVGRLLEAGADANQAAQNGKTPLYIAAQDGHETVVGRLLEAGADANQTNQKGWTPLCKAADKGHEAVVGRLLVAGADISLHIM
eukprot:COSAG05_NODE_3146_length_2287_cov_4.953382_1_plen_122_part_00